MPDFSIIIEWENAKISELGRARAMLRTLREQATASLARLGPTPELLVLYDRDEIDAGLINGALEEAGYGDGPFGVQVLPVEHLGYYGLKNRGAEIATGKTLIFLDSDVIPEAGWLDALLDAYAMPDVFIAGGSVDLSTDTAYERAFAAFWFFAEERDRRDVWHSKTFYANNFAIDREAFLAYRFPATEAFRGACILMGTRANADRKFIVTHGSARVTHPPPNGLRHFLVRALCEGHDQTVLWKAQSRNAGEVGAIMPFKRSFWAARMAFERIGSNAKAVGLGASETALAYGLASLYHIIALIGDCATSVSPRLIRDNFTI
jgi:glycosyltransferase involved in cell wall biosynthesis